MGCMKSTDGSQKPQNAIIMQVNKMKIIFQQEQNKFESKAKEKFSQFQTQIQKPIKQRNKDIQKIKLQEVVIFKNKRHICNILENDCIKIIDNKHLIGNQKYFETIAPNVKQILFAQSILHDENITSFKMMIYKKYPDVTQSQIQDIKSDIMKHHKVQQFPTHKMVNDFVLLSCRQNQMDLAKINASGNQFRYGV